MQLRNELSVLSNYYRITSGEYVAELIATEKNVELMNLKISMPAKKQPKRSVRTGRRKIRRSIHI